MKDALKDQTFTFQIKGIEILDIKLNYPKKPLPTQTIFNFSIGLKHKINPENRLVIVITTIDILHEDKETLLASLQASCIFEIKNFEDYLIDGSQQVLFPEKHLVTLNSISISTVRGIMFSQFKGTFLHTAILPVIDPKDFVKNNAE
jgi:hypothetical protein